MLAGAQWTLQNAIKLYASDGDADDQLGYCMSVSGELAVIGTGGDEVNGLSSGSAYVCRNDGTSWIVEANLLALDGDAYDYFGSALDVSGDVIVLYFTQSRGNDIMSEWLDAAWALELHRDRVDVLSRP